MVSGFFSIETYYSFIFFMGIYPGRKCSLKHKNPGVDYKWLKGVRKVDGFSTQFKRNPEVIA